MIEFLPEDRISIQEALALPFFREEIYFDDFDDFGFSTSSTPPDRAHAAKIKEDSSPIFPTKLKVLKS